MERETERDRKSKCLQYFPKTGGKLLNAMQQECLWIIFFEGKTEDIKETIRFFFYSRCKFETKCSITYKMLDIFQAHILVHGQ